MSIETKLYEKEEFIFTQIKKNHYKIFLFLLSVNETNKQWHINEFCQKYNISNPEYKQKINDYYTLFIELKSSIY